MKNIIFPSKKSSSIYVFIRSGSIYEPKEIKGISHFVEHLLFRRTKKYPGTESLKKKFDELGVRIAAFTYEYYTIFNLEISQKLKKKAKELLKDILFNTIFKFIDLKKEKELIKEEIAYGKSDPNIYIFERFASFIFKNTSLEIPIIGNEKTIENISFKDISNWYKNYYQNKNVIFLEAGDVSRKDIFKKEFKFLPGPKIYPTEKPKIIRKRWKNLNNAIVLGYLIKNPDFRERIILNLLSLIIGGLETSIYFHYFVLPGIAYSGGSYVQNFNGCSLLVFYLFSQKEIKEDKILKLIKNQKEIEKRFQIAKTFLMNNYYNKIADGSYLEEIGRELMIFGESKSFEEKLKIIKNIKTKDIKLVLEKLVGPYGIILER